MSFTINRALRNQCALSDPSSPPASAGLQVDGNRISWADDGWYEVQSAVSYNTMSEGGRFADMPAGLYNVINHTTGQRFENIQVGPTLPDHTTTGAGFDPASDSRSSLVTTDYGSQAILNGAGVGQQTMNDRPRDGASARGSAGGIGEVREFHLSTGQVDPVPGSLLNPDNHAPFSDSSVNAYINPHNDVLVYDISPPDYLDDSPASRASNPPSTRATLTVHGEGTPDETHVITTETPDTSSSSSNQPHTITTTVINARGVLATDSRARTPTGMEVGPAGHNGVQHDEDEIALSNTSSTSSTGTTFMTSRLPNQRSDNDSNGRSSTGSSDFGDRTSQPGGMGGV